MNYTWDSEILPPFQIIRRFDTLKWPYQARTSYIFFLEKRTSYIFEHRNSLLARAKRLTVNMNKFDDECMVSVCLLNAEIALSAELMKTSAVHERSYLYMSV